jgi:energy coupling factor transporter S component ThiW
MNKQKSVLKMAVLSMFIALGVVISPIPRFEGMCPMAHFINIVCSVFMGPWYSLLCAFLIGIIRMSIMGIPPIALTGAIFGAYLSGVFYRMSKGKLLFAVLGEIIGTGIIGAILSYPVMSIFRGKEGIGWLFYVPSFICGTLIGGSIAFVFLKKLSNSGMISKIQAMLSSGIYKDTSGYISEAFSIAAFGVICFMVIKILAGIFKMNSPIWSYLAIALLFVFLVWSIVYYFSKKVIKNDSE